MLRGTLPHHFSLHKTPNLLEQPVPPTQAGHSFREPVHFYFKIVTLTFVTFYFGTVFRNYRSSGKNTLYTPDQAHLLCLCAPSVLCLIILSPTSLCLAQRHSFSLPLSHQPPTRYFFLKQLRVRCLCLKLIYPWVLQCVFPKNKDILLHDHSPVVKTQS